MLSKRSPKHQRWSHVLAAFAASVTLLAGAAVTPAVAAPKKSSVSAGKKYFWSIIGVFPKATIDPAIATQLKPVVLAQVTKTLAAHPQIAAALPDGSDVNNPDAFKRMLSKAKIAGAYTVSVDISDASEEIIPIENKPGELKLVVRLSVHLLGEVMPDKTIGFTGDGSATIREEVGKKLRPNDRDFVWAAAVEGAVNDAVATAMKTLSKPAPAPPRKPKRK
jgi:hypothetical protein